MTVEMQLLERTAKRDRQPFAELYDGYVDQVYKYFYYTTCTRSDAENLTALVLFQVREAIEENRLEGEPLATWLDRLAHDQFMDYCRAYGQTRPLANAPMFASGDDLPVTAGRGCTSGQIHAAIQHLPPDQQEVTVLRFLKGYSSARVAVIMDRPPDAIRALQQSALQALEPWLGDETSSA